MLQKAVIQGFKCLRDVNVNPLGLAIVGDSFYGGGAGPRLLLHAAFLRFPHPRTGILREHHVPPGPAFGL